MAKRSWRLDGLPTVAESGRRYGLGMWIVNNTCTMSGGEIQKICGEKGFEIEFTIGGKI